MPAVPEISVERLRDKLRSADEFVLLDVREPAELELARITDHRLVALPTSILGAEGLQGLPVALRSPASEVFVLCHHGVRSAQVARWLLANGWSNVFSVLGGIDAYSGRIDPSIPRY